MFPAKELSEAMSQHHTDELIERIRQLYSRRERRLVPFPWCEYFFNLKDIYTNLKIVNKEKRGGTLTDDEIVNMTGIFRPNTECQNPRIVLIEGDPGMGKTTLSQKLAYDWANTQDEWDTFFPAFELLLFLRCKDIKSSIWEAIDDQLLPHDIDEQAKENFFKYILENQSKVLLLLDGLDEADPCELKMYSSLVEGKLLSRCYIVITSRHEAGMKVKRFCDTLWEIVGFTKEHSTRFIREYFQGQEHLAEKLIGQLESDSSSYLGVLTKTPLNVALLCLLCEELEGVLPTNVTQLYIEIVLCFLRRYEQKNSLSSGGEDLFSVYRSELARLGSYALDSVLKGEYSFDIPNEIFKSINFGFLSMQQGSTKHRPCIRCAFINRGFQEFFAGFYLAFQIINKEIDCASVVADDRYLDELRQVFSFMSGILASQSEDTAVSLICVLSAHINVLLRQPYRDVRSYMRLACECISECSVIAKQLESCLVCTLGEHLDMSPVNSLTLWNSGIHSAGAAAISRALAAHCSLTYLDLSDNSIGDAGTACLSEFLAVNSSLTQLYVSNNEISDSGASSLSKALAANVSLIYLNLRNNSLGDAGASSLAQALAVNTSLTTLDLSQNRIDVSGASCLSQALTANSSLTSLNFSYNRIDDVGATSLSQALAANTSLTSLDLRQTCIGVAGASSLSQALAVNSFLTKLDLSHNSIGDAGASCLSQALAANSALISLNLRNNSIGNSGACSLSQAIQINSSLTDLNLGSNSISDRGFAAISKALTINSSLIHLDLRYNRIDDIGAACFSAILL